MASRGTVLITGATSGIGRVTALHLATRGFRVIASGRRADALGSLAAESGGAIEPVPMDVTAPASVNGADAEIERRTQGHGLDALVNNAGYGQGGPLELLSDDEIRAQYETNVFGLLRVTRTFLPKMRERRSGRIVHVGSVYGHLGPEHVARAIERALTDVRPRDRYCVPRRTAWLVRMRTMLPTGVTDAILNRLSGLASVRV